MSGRCVSSCSTAIHGGGGGSEVSGGCVSSCSTAIHGGGGGGGGGGGLK